MTVPQEQESVVVGEVDGYWSGTLDNSRTPSPGIPAKRMKMTLDEITDIWRQEQLLEDNEYDNLLRLQKTPESLGYDNVGSFRALWFSSDDSPQEQNGKKKMQTGCIPCLYVVEQNVWGLVLHTNSE